MNRPSPARLSEPLAEVADVERHRDTTCPRVDACLTIAENWRGFSCRGCPVGCFAHLPAPEWHGDPVGRPAGSSGPMARVLLLVASEPREWTAADVHAALPDCTPGGINSALKRHVAAGMLRRVRRGVFEAVTP